jgi:hypothetical protein
MKTQEIRTDQWKNFCDQFSQINQGSLVTLEMAEPDGTRTEIARNTPLQKITLDKSDPCNDVISISVGEPGKRCVTHLVVEPIHLKYKQTGERNKTLQMEAENGTTLLTFHSGRFPEVTIDFKLRDETLVEHAGW